MKGGNLLDRISSAATPLWHCTDNFDRLQNVPVRLQNTSSERTQLPESILLHAPPLSTSV